MEERRRSLRVPINQPADLRVEDGLKSIPCTIEDISSGGMRVSLGKRLFPEAFSNATFALVDNLSFNVGAHVAWQVEGESVNTYGLSFDRIEDTDINRISGYIQENAYKNLRNQWWKGL